MVSEETELRRITGECFVLLTARIRSMTGRYCFYRCLSVNISGGVPGPGPGRGAPRSRSRWGGPRSRSRGTQVQVQGGYPVSGLGGYPVSGLGGVPGLSKGKNF